MKPSGSFKNSLYSCTLEYTLHTCMYVYTLLYTLNLLIANCITTKRNIISRLGEAVYEKSMHTHTHSQCSDSSIYGGWWWWWWCWTVGDVRTDNASGVCIDIEIGMGSSRTYNGAHIIRNT